MNFDSTFWHNKLEELGYKVNPVTFDIEALRDQRVIPKDVEPTYIQRLSDEELVEVAIIGLARDKRLLTRSRCATIARNWKENRMVKPFLIFTDGVESYAVIVPGRGIGGEAKILNLSGELYRTDIEVLSSIRHPGTFEELNRRYDEVFFPYQKVRDDFFIGYRDLYQKLEKQVRKIIPKDSSGYAQRFLGRLMFLYFLQRKEWLRNDRKYIDTIKDYRELNNIIYEGLCTGHIQGIPFLNGSLFEKEPYLDKAMEARLYPKVNPIFLEARSFFNQYNFTVDESSPLDLDVSIDPALIGTVFENMLPEQERGSKGTFYTPRNEISFICRRALVNWLRLKDEVKPLPGGGEEFVDGIDALVEELREKKDEVRVRELKRRILSANVLDPAVGSGGFLLGAMQEIIEFIHKIEETVGWKTDPEDLKKRILPNLYGFDIESEAIEIARLRLWLSLIIDQKVPTHLPNLDLNLVEVQDSLNKPVKNRQMTFGTLEKAKKLKERFHELSAKYLNETDPVKKSAFKEERLRISKELEDLTGLDPNTIEASMHTEADIVVMNPPFVRQEEIPANKKEAYVKQYGLDKKSDIFTYFLVRVLDLLAEGGVASVISSDKWLETGYGESLQRKLVNHIVSIYGQRERSFGADINTVITVYTKQVRREAVWFTYLEKYGDKKVVRSVNLQRRQLIPGKWFYLRAPKLFMEKILPKLTHKLGDFAEIKFGVKTGANDFFYLKDISHLYEVDYHANPKRFQEWGVTAKTQKELEQQGLIYIENQIGFTCVINEKDVSSIIKSPTELDSYIIKKGTNIIFDPKPRDEPSKLSLKYIKWGEQQEVEIKRGSNKGKLIKGYNKLETTKNRKPNWFNIPDLKPSHIIPNRFINERHFTSYSIKPIVSGDACALVYPKNVNDIILWGYMNSIVFYLVEELYGMRAGAGALQILAGEYKKLPCININEINVDVNYIFDLLNRVTLNLNDEVKNIKRGQLDNIILNILNLDDDDDEVLDLIYESIIDVMQDRLIKGK